MATLKIIFVVMLCVPLIYISFVLVNKLMDDYIRHLKKKK